MIKSRKAFTLLEVLVAVVIVSISLLWSTYLLSNALDWKFRSKQENIYSNKIDFFYAQVIADDTKKVILKQGGVINFGGGKNFFLAEPVFFCPFADDYLDKISILDHDPPDLFENIKKIPPEKRKENCFFLVRVALLDNNQKFLAEKIFPFPE